MEKSGNLGVEKLSQYLYSKFLETGRNLSDELESSMDVIEAMKKIYKNVGSIEIINDNKIFPNLLHDFVPRNNDKVWISFRNPKVTAILSRFLDGSSWDIVEYERQIQLALRDLEENIRPRVSPYDARNLVMWTICSFGKELNLVDLTTNSKMPEKVDERIITQKSFSEDQELSKHEKKMNVLTLLTALRGSKNLDNIIRMEDYSLEFHLKGKK